MSLVERFYPANFVLNRVVIIYFHSWHFMVSLYKKNSFDSVQSCFSRVIANMRDRKKHFRHILLFYYRKSKNGVQTRKKLRKVYGEDVLTVVTRCENWFSKFRSGNFDVARFWKTN